jgi:hypothetical protein
MIGLKLDFRVRDRNHRRRGVRAILCTVIAGDSIVAALTNINNRALNTNVSR